jgi:hypothetical protein
VRRFAGLVIALVLAACATASAPAPAAAPADTNVIVTVQPIALVPARPKQTRIGRLIYRGGLELKSRDNRFGGLSDLSVSADGKRVLFVSDASNWVRAWLKYDDEGNLAGMDEAEIDSMRDVSGNPLEGKDGDAEGLAAETSGNPSGSVLVSFERDHRVWRYDLSNGLDAKPTPVPVGSWVDSLPDNQGLEAIALLPRDTLLAVSETTRNNRDDIVGALEAVPAQVGHGGFGPISVAADEPYAVTSAAPDGDGGVFILERRFSFLGGFGAVIRHVPAPEIRPGARLEGTVIADLSSANIDNMEGIAARRADGKTFLYVVSDDNFRGWQRTLLLMFEVVQ